MLILGKTHQSANTKPPQKFVNLPYPSEKSQRSKDADRLNPSGTTLGSPFIKGGGEGGH
jgi:hypothetical protein